MTYNFMEDFAGSYTLALRLMALRIGSVLPANGFEWYFVEQQIGGIP